MLESRKVGKIEQSEGLLEGGRQLFFGDARVERMLESVHAAAYASRI